MATLFSLFGSLALMGLVISGLLLMVAPAWGRELLKRTAAAIGLFLLGFMLLQIGCHSLGL
jgi:hypothetical protein